MQRDHAIQFSGGKDSLAALYLCEGLWNRCIVFYGDTGGFYPHMVKFVHETCNKLNLPLQVVKPNISLEDYHKMNGLPSDMIPVELSVEMRPYNRNKGLVLQSPIRCCSVMQWQGLHKALVDSGIKNVIRGSKKCDQHVGMGDGYVDANGITYHCPVWEWSDEAVFTYLRRIGVDTAAHYSDVNNSFDCILCTAYFRSDGAKARLEYTKKHYPEHMPELSRRVNLVRDAIKYEQAAVLEVMAVIEQDEWSKEDGQG